MKAFFSRGDTTARALGVLLSLALVLHILSAVGVFMLRPESISTTPDPLDYRLAALNLLDYHTFSLAPPEFNATELLRTPAYPFVLAGTYLLDGRTGLAMILLQSCLLVGMGWMLFILLRRFSVSPRVSLMLTALYLFEPLQWLYTLLTMTETLASFFVLVLIVLALSEKGVSTLARAAVFGVGLGFLVFIKPSAIMWVPFLLALVFASAGSLRHHVMYGAIALCVLLATLSPWIVRNYVLTGYPIVSSSDIFNFILAAGTPDTIPSEYWKPIIIASYNGHSNQVWYAYTVEAYPMLRATKKTILEHFSYPKFLLQQVGCMPSVWFGSLHTKDQETYGHEYGLISDFALGTNAARDHMIDLADTVIWSGILLLALLGSWALFRTPVLRWWYLPLLAMLVATIGINFCLAWVRVILPMYPVILLATGAGVMYLIRRFHSSSL